MGTKFPGRDPPWMFSRPSESLRTAAGSGSSLKFPGRDTLGPLKTAPAQGRVCPGGDTSVAVSTPVPAPLRRPCPGPEPEGADVIQSQGPSWLLGRDMPFLGPSLPKAPGTAAQHEGLNPARAGRLAPAPAPALTASLSPALPPSRRSPDSRTTQEGPEGVTPRGRGGQVERSQ